MEHHVVEGVWTLELRRLGHAETLLHPPEYFLTAHACNDRVIQSC